MNSSLLVSGNDVIYHEYTSKSKMAFDLSGLGISEISSVGHALSGSADDYANDPQLELAWAMKTMNYAETHMKLIQSVDAVQLRLTKEDDAIHSVFAEMFANLKIDVIIEDDIKSEENKKVWREFCNKFEGKVEDYNFGTLLRLDVSKEYSDKNTTLVPRVQFLAIEIARNRSGLNTRHFKKGQSN